jgi:hypothetical protein
MGGRYKSHTRSDTQAEILLGPRCCYIQAGLSHSNRNACNPSQVKATCNAVMGGGSILTAVVTGAAASQERAAEGFSTLSGKKHASVIRG